MRPSERRNGDETTEDAAGRVYPGGEYRALDLLDGYGALDRLAAAAKDPQSPYGKILREMTGFMDWERTDDWSNELYKSVVDATLWDQPTS